MNKTLKTQNGMSMIVILIIMSVAAFFGMFAFKVGPSYIEYMTVAKIADDVASNADLMKQPKSKVMSYISKAYRTNNLWDMKADETILLKKDHKKGYIVEVDYEKRANLLANIEVVTVFKKTAGTP